MLNIREIAKIAGVGKSTVSRVINQTGYVSDETRKKIEAVMQEYEYSPSAVARNLSKQQTNSIGIIIPQANNPFFDEILTALLVRMDILLVLVILLMILKRREML